MELLVMIRKIYQDLIFLENWSEIEAFIEIFLIDIQIK